MTLMNLLIAHKNIEPGSAQTGLTVALSVNNGEMNGG